MEFGKFDDLVGRGAASLGIALDTQQSENLYRYYLELKHWSKKVNLISREATDEQIVENHFIDSLALVSVLDGRSGALFDIGSGAGFPGLVCKTARPERVVSLIEPRLKRTSFLRHVIRSIGLAGIDVQSCRLEDGVALEGESTSRWVVSRAVTNVADFLGMCERFKKRQSFIVCMKGPRYQEEFDTDAVESDGWLLKTTTSYELPFSKAERALLIFQGID